MNLISSILFYSVGLWALVESRHVNGVERTLKIEDKGHNLTEKLQQEDIHAEALQHFTLLSTSTQTTVPAFFNEDTLVLEDSNVQSLKNDESLVDLNDKAVFVNKMSPDTNFSDEAKTRLKGTVGISLRYNQTGYLNNGRAENRPSVNKFFINEKQLHSSEGFTEPTKATLDWKNVENKKKEKSKKELLETITVPNDHFKLEKPIKDNLISIKLKEKNKDLISDALDEQRSTISVSNSSSLSVSENDKNNNTLGSLDIFKADSSVSDDLVSQDVNSVLNGISVNSETTKRSRVKYSTEKRTEDVGNHNKTENSSASDNQLFEEAVKKTVSETAKAEIHTIPVILPDLTITDNFEPVTTYPPPKPTDSAPTKIEMFGKFGPSSSTTIAKPSNVFKQQLVNKLKSLDPSPTVSLASNEELDNENLEKSSSKLPTKPNIKKKAKPDYYSEIYIPPTATAWTLVSMKTVGEDLKTSSKTTVSPDIDSHKITNTSSMEQLTTTIPVTHIKNVVSWPSRPLKATTMKPPTLTDTSVKKHAQPSESTINSTPYLTASVVPEQRPTLITNVEAAAIHTTQDLLNNNTLETSINLIQDSLNDVMIRDQSSTQSHDIVTSTEEPANKSQTINSSFVTQKDVILYNQVVEKENLIETTKTPDIQKDSYKKIGQIEKNLESIKNSGENVTQKTNEESYTESRVNNGDVNTSYVNGSSYNVLTLSSTTPTPEESESSKIKNTNDSEEFDSVFSDILGEGGDDAKSLEEDDEYEKTTYRSTLHSIFDPFETTVAPDIEEDDDVDEKLEDELSMPEKIDSTHLNYSNFDNVTHHSIGVITNNTFNAEGQPRDLAEPNNTKMYTEENIKLNVTTETSSNMSMLQKIYSFEGSTYNLTTPYKEIIPPTTPRTVINGSYVTSFDIVAKDNATQVTETPSQGDKNWYEVDSKAINIDVDQTTNKMLLDDVTTIMASAETTLEPEITTDLSNQQTTILPEISIRATTQSATTDKVTKSPTITEVHELEPQKEDVEDADACVLSALQVAVRNYCYRRKELQANIASQFDPDVNVSPEQVVLTNRERHTCASDQSRTYRMVNIDICFLDEHNEPSPFLKEKFEVVLDSTYGNMSPDEQGFDNVFAAVVLSIIAAICLVLLGILLVIVRKRQGRFNYGQRCTPVSLDDYSLDNISVYNSVRRKGHRASKRSYGNPAFDDPGGPTRPLNFAGLTNFSSDTQALEEEFSQIPIITVKPDELPPGAESKNRYANVIPLPETRVPLQAKEGSDILDEYINANYVKGPKSQEKIYIACQAPLQSTIEDFWRMVWQQQSKVILMLTSLTENGVEKCADYLPQLEVTDCHRMFGDFQVTLKKHEVRDNYIISTLQLKNLETNLWREVTHLWYSSWPAQGVPEDGSSLIAFLIEARSYARGSTGPIVTHCSPGTGRTGTVIAIDLCIRDFETLRTVDIPRTVYALRRDRAGSVQTKGQYTFIYQVLNLYATKLTGGGMDSI